MPPKHVLKARSKKPTQRDSADDVEEEETSEEHQTIMRDYAMARLGAALASLDTAKATVIEALTYFVSPDEDAKNKKRSGLVDTALEHAGCATRALECLDEVMDEYDPEEPEPWDDEEDDEEEAD